VINAGLGFYAIYFFKVFALQFLLKYVFEVTLVIPVAYFFKRLKLLPLSIIISPLHVIYLIYIGFIGNATTYTWKGRVVR
jgi:hypothetical protein